MKKFDMEMILPLEILIGDFVLYMKNRLFFEALANKFADIKEKYGDDYPIILYEPAIKCQEKKVLKGLLRGNNSIHLFTEFREASKFVQSLGISFILIVSKYFDEKHVIHNFGGSETIFGRAMFDFEEEAFLKRVLKEISDETIKFLNLKSYVFCTLFDCLTEAKTNEDEEEVLLMCDVKEIVNQFRQDFVIILYDPFVNAESISKFEKGIEVDIEEKNIYRNFQELLVRIKDDSSIPYHIILSGEIKSEAQKLVKDIENLKNFLGLYIVCDSDDVQMGQNENISIAKSLEELFPKIKEGIRTRSKLRITFPAFATNFDSSDRSGLYKLHFYLKSLVNFHNRKQAKGDFIKLARKIYQAQDKELESFEKTYNEYDKVEILKWYTKDSSIYRLINNCLRISSSDSILYCRLFLKDLERAIREKYQEKSKDFSGEVYRGAYISTEEWEKLVRNIGQEIEMYGFLSTTKNQKIALRFLKGDLENKVLIKIIIPALPESDEQGFADVFEFSQFPNEEEVLFNVRSRFKILQAAISKIDGRGTKCRELVLLYGAHSLRKYMTKTKPSIEIKLELPPEIKCNLCGSKDKLFGFEQNGTCVNCFECLIEGSLPEDIPLIALDEEKEKEILQILPGKILASQKTVSFSNCGYKCCDCEATEKNKYYKWMSCEGKDILVQCSECLKVGKTIKHKILISENSPFVMWQDQQMEWEKINQKFQEVLLQITGENQGRAEMEVENYDRCIEYGKLVVDKFKHQRRREMFKSIRFNILGEAFLSSGKYQQALGYFTSCLDLVILIGNQKFLDAVNFRCRIAEIYYHLAENQKAEKCFQQALNIQLSTFGENHEATTGIYHGLAVLYEQWGEQQKAFTYFTKTISIQKSLGRENHPDIAATYGNFAGHYRNLGMYAEALEYAHMSHHILKSVFGKKNSHTSSSYSHLALFYRDLGKYNEAEKLFIKAIEIQIIIHGATHPKTATSYQNLAKIYQRLGRHQEALEYFNPFPTAYPIKGRA